MVKSINRCKEEGSRRRWHGGGTRTVVQVEVKDLMGNQSTKPHHNRRRTSTGKKDRRTTKKVEKIQRVIKLKKTKEGQAFGALVCHLLKLTAKAQGDQIWTQESPPTSKSAVMRMLLIVCSNGRVSLHQWRRHWGTLFSQSGFAGKLLTGCGLRLIDFDVITYTLIGNKTGLITRQPDLQSAVFVKRHWARPML